MVKVEGKESKYIPLASKTGLTSRFLYLQILTSYKSEEVKVTYMMLAFGHPLNFTIRVSWSAKQVAPVIAKNLFPPSALRISV